MNQTSKSEARLLPYYFILYGMSVGLGGIVALVAELKNNLGFSDFDIGLTISSGFAAAFVASLITAPLADRGHAPVMLRSALVIGIISLITLSVGQDLWHYLVGRGAYGLALGSAYPAAKRTVIVADPEHMGRNLGRMGAADMAGFMTAPLVVTALTALTSWRIAFLGIAILLFAVLPATFKAQPDTAKKDIDRQGLKGLLRIRRLNGALLVTMSMFVLIGAFEAIWVLELDHRGASQTFIGLALTAVALPIAVLSPIGGTLAQKYGARKWGISIWMIHAVVTLFYGLVPGLWILLSLAFFCGVLEGFGFSAASMLVSAAVSEDRQAAAQGLMTAVEVGTGAIASLGMAAIYSSSGDTLAWLVTSISMSILLVAGYILTKPEDLKPVRPGVPLEKLRRPFE